MEEKENGGKLMGKHKKKSKKIKEKNGREIEAKTKRPPPPFAEIECRGKYPIFLEFSRQHSIDRRNFGAEGKHNSPICHNDDHRIICKRLVSMTRGNSNGPAEGMIAIFSRQHFLSILCLISRSQIVPHR